MHHLQSVTSSELCPPATTDTQQLLLCCSLWFITFLLFLSHAVYQDFILWLLFLLCQGYDWRCSNIHLNTWDKKQYLNSWDTISSSSTSFPNQHAFCYLTTQHKDVNSCVNALPLNAHIHHNYEHVRSICLTWKDVATEHDSFLCQNVFGKKNCFSM